MNKAVDPAIHSKDEQHKRNLDLKPTHVQANKKVTATPAAQKTKQKPSVKETAPVSKPLSVEEVLASRNRPEKKEKAPASKPTTESKKPIIGENTDFKSRMKKLANII